MQKTYYQDSRGHLTGNRQCKSSLPCSTALGRKFTCVMNGRPFLARQEFCGSWYIPQEKGISIFDRFAKNDGEDPNAGQRIKIAEEHTSTRTFGFHFACPVAHVRCFKCFLFARFTPGHQALVNLVRKLFGKSRPKVEKPVSPHRKNN